MGTSAPGGGPRPTTPLIPGWISDADSPPNDPLPEQTPEIPLPDLQPPSPPDDEMPKVGTTNDIPSEPLPLLQSEVANRFAEARSRYTSFSRDHSDDNRGALRDSLRSYVSKGGGGARTLATRMRPAAARVASFYNVMNTFKQGVADALRTFNLTIYEKRPIVDILSALTDFIFSDDDQYSNIQDDSITKYAYANTINRIAEFEEINFDSLTNDNIELMMAVFIEETIATRVICDIGAKLFKVVQDCQEIISVEEATYQIVRGLVRTQIMPQIIATQRGQSQDIEQNIERIYRTAFDCIAGATDI